MSASDWPTGCHRCGAELTPGEGSLYVVRIEALADPTPPVLDLDTPAGEIRYEIDELIESMRDASPQEMMDQVYRRMTRLLCTRCYKRWIDNPTG